MIVEVIKVESTVPKDLSFLINCYLKFQKEQNKKSSLKVKNLLNKNKKGK